jgi:hypothetical protein
MAMPDPIDDIDLEEKPFIPNPEKRTIENLDVEQKPFPVPKEFEDVVSREVAHKILEVFKLSTLGVLAVGGFLFLFILGRSYTPQELESIVDKGFVSFLRGAATFATTVFGPLLAFILGFYFGKNKKADHGGESAQGNDSVRE